MSGIDIFGQHSKGMDAPRGTLFDLAVTVCDRAKEICPICGVSLQAASRIPATKETIHRDFKGPTTVKGSDEDQLNASRQAKDRIKNCIAQDFGK